MSSCSACRRDCRHTSDVCPLSSRLCADCLCETCITRLFRRDMVLCNPCPACGDNAKADDFFDCRPDVQEVEPAASLRRRISGNYCKKREDFADAPEHSDYFEQREDLISRLDNPSSVEDVQDAWRHVEHYEEENREQIQREHGWEPRKARKSEPLGQSNAHSPQQSDCQLLQEQPCETFGMITDDAGIWAPDSPSSPQAARLLQSSKVRHMSGGGQTPNTHLKKARLYFFQDLAKGSRALAGGA